MFAEGLVSFSVRFAHRSTRVLTFSEVTADAAQRPPPRRE